MYKEQLMKAFQLMKDGEKGQAAVMVKGVLREDPKNLNAWWLMSNLLEDEAKVVKALERVLSIDPNHQVARQRLSQLRPEYSNLAPDDSKAIKQSKKDAAKADKDYWAKLDRGPQPVKKSGGFLKILGNGLVLRLVLAGIILIGAGIWSVVNNIGSQNALYDEQGRTPQNAVEAYLLADYLQDVDGIYAATCPELHGYIDEAVAQYPEYYPASSVDFSRTRFLLDHHDWFGGQGYVIMEGDMLFEDELGSWEFNWVEDAKESGYDHYGQFTRKIDGVWLVCVEYNVPNLDYERE